MRAAVLLVTLAFQAPEQLPSIFRSRLDVIPLSVIVVDSAGLPVRDLTLGDFQIFEDDQLQDISVFGVRSIDHKGESSAEGTAVRIASVNQRRSFLLVFGDGRVDGPARGIDGAVSFVRDHVQPGDEVGVLAFNRASSFTTDHRAVLEILERFRRDHEGIVFDLREWLARRRATQVPPHIQARMDRVFGDALAHSAEDLLLRISAVPPADEPVWNRQVTIDDLHLRAERADQRLSDMAAFGRTSPEVKLYAAIEHLRTRAGSRQLVWIGNGLRLRSVEDDRRMAARAADANVVLNVIYTSGVGIRSGGGLATAWDIAAGQRIARLTGGYFAVTRYAKDAVKEIADRIAWTYELGYVPRNPRFDGRYRRIRVAVLRAGATAQHREGYYAR